MLEKIRKELKQLEIIVGNIKNYVEIEQNKQIEVIFKKLNSPLHRIPILMKLGIKIIQIDDGVSFRTTENSIVYMINDRNFIAIYPQLNALKVEYAVPGGWDSCKLTDEDEIDGIIDLVEESCDFIREKVE